jgi:predicted anti-sigma-YlaC factor YlaD
VEVVRAFLLAFGLATIVMGLFLLFAGYVHIGCSVGGTTANPTSSNCSAATDLEIAGAVLTIAAVMMFLGGFVPDSSSRYK